MTHYATTRKSTRNLNAVQATRESFRPTPRVKRMNCWFAVYWCGDDSTMTTSLLPSLLRCCCRSILRAASRTSWTLGRSDAFRCRQESTNWRSCEKIDCCYSDHWNALYTSIATILGDCTSLTEEVDTAHIPRNSWDRSSWLWRRWRAAEVLPSTSITASFRLFKRMFRNKARWYLIQKTSHGPDIGWEIVTALVEALWAHVIRCAHQAVDLDGIGAEKAAQTQIAEFDDQVFRDEDVGRLDI